MIQTSSPVGTRQQQEKKIWILIQECIKLLNLVKVGTRSFYFLKNVLGLKTIKLCNFFVVRRSLEFGVMVLSLGLAIT